MAETEMDPDRLRIELEVEDVDKNLFKDVSVKEVILGESLLTPGLQTAVTLQSAVHTMPPKKWNELKNKKLKIKLDRPGLTRHGFQYTQLEIENMIYRMDKRRQITNNVSNNEEFNLHCCHVSMLNDIKSLVSKSWKCTEPSKIAEYVLRNCTGAYNVEIEKAGPARDYIAENIHPFQVVAQQTNVALANGNDPSFVHFMTYKNLGTHYFQSLATMIKKKSKYTFKYSETGDTTGYANPFAVMGFSFPCDFDYMTDLLNGVDENGQDKNTLSTINPLSKSASQMGNQSSGCGIGGYNYKTALTNQGTAKEQNSCNMDVEQHMLKRQARMSLIERDKIALRITVPWNPMLQVGDVITFEWINKLDEEGQTKVFGSGDYLVVSLMHKIIQGGLGVITMDCISNTALG
jgi:hypothetical protein